MGNAPSVAVVGCGRAGGAIALALQRAGYDLTAIWCRTADGTLRAQQLVDAPVAREPSDAAATAGLTVVAVPDDAIEETATRVSAGVRPGTLVAHTSGSVSIGALDPVRAAGGRVGSIHPLQTLPDALTGADALRGAAVAVTASGEEREILRRVARDWGGEPFDLPDAARTLYHAAAVFASNYVVASISAARRLLEDAGVDPEAIGALARRSVENALTSGAAALTGPVARGDLRVLRRHAAALSDPALGEAYRAMAALSARFAGLDLEAVREATA